MSFIEDLGLQTANGLVNSLGSLVGTNYATKKQKELMDYQWNNYQSPAAQVRNMAAAGLNPAVAFGNQAPVISSSPTVPSVEAPQFGIGTTSLSDLSGYIKSLADAKKAGADTNLAEKEAELKKIETDRQEFELNMRKLFGPKEEWINVSTAAANLRLATLSGDNAQIQKEMGEYTKAKEAALAKTAEHERDMAEKELNNLDLKLKLQNNVLRETANTEKSKQSANYAAADLSKASAATERTQKQIYDEEREIKKLERKFRESTQTQEIEAKLAELRANKIISDKDYEEGKKKLDSIQKFNQARENSKAVEAGYLFFDWLSDILSGPLKGVLK